MSSTRVNTPSRIRLDEILVNYKPENEDNEIYLDQTFCLVEQANDSNVRFWISFHDSFDDIVGYCTDPENIDVWLPHQVVNLHDGTTYRPVRSINFTPTRS